MSEQPVPTEHPVPQNNPEYLEQYPNAVQDVDKAHEMANAGDEERTKAAVAREAGRAIDSIVDRKEEIVDSLLEPAQEFNDSRQAFSEATDGSFQGLAEDDPVRVRSSKAYGGLYGTARQLDLPEIPGIKSDVSVANDMLRATEQASGREEVLAAFESATRKHAYPEVAKKRDKQAERLEAWAAILHDNPPSEAFKEKYSGKYISPRELVRMEEVTAERERYAAAEVESLTKLLASPDVVFWGRTLDLRILVDETGGDYILQDLATSDFTLDPNRLFAMAYGEHSAEAGEWQHLTADPNTTIGQLHGKYQAAVWELATPILDRYKIEQAFLDDIRSGRAAQWQ